MRCHLHVRSENLQILSRLRQTMIGGQAIPPGGLFIVLRDTLAMLVSEPDFIFGRC